MARQRVKASDLQLGDIIAHYGDNGEAAAFIYQIHRNDNGISGFSVLQIMDDYLNRDNDERANITGRHIGQEPGRTFVINYAPQQFDLRRLGFKAPDTTINRFAQTAGTIFYQNTMERANHLKIGSAIPDRTSGTMRSGLERLGDFAVWAKGEAPAYTGAGKRKPTKRRASSDCIVTIPDIKLDEAVKVGLLSEDAVNALTVAVKGIADYQPPVMLSAAFDLIIPKKKRETKAEIQAEGQRQRHFRGLVETNLQIANEQSPSPLSQDRQERNLKRRLRDLIREANTVFKHDIGLMHDTTVEPHVRASVQEKYAGITVLHPKHVIQARALV